MTPAPTAGRIAWLDLARAISIVLVVLYHVAISSGAVLLGEGSAASAWSWANLALIPLRMPLFFVIAGVLAASASRRPLRRTVRPRILDLLWPYLLWSLLFAVLGWPRYAPGDPGGFIAGEITGMLVLASPYWFIAVLPIFFLLGRCGSGHPRAMLLIALIAYFAAPWARDGLLSVGASGDLAYGVFQLADNALWYLLGLVLSARIRRWGTERTPERTAPRLAVGAALLGLLAVLAILVMEAPLPHPVIRAGELGASISGIAACVLLLPVLARIPSVARAGEYVGSRTLVIYLVHPIVLIGAVVAFRWTVPGGIGGPTAALLLIPAVVVIALALSLAVDAVIDRWGPDWLLAAPRRPRVRAAL